MVILRSQMKVDTANVIQLIFTDLPNTRIQKGMDVLNLLLNYLTDCSYFLILKNARKILCKAVYAFKPFISCIEANHSCCFEEM